MVKVIILIPFLLITTVFSDMRLINGNFYMEAGRYADALPFYEKYLESYPEDEVALYHQGKCLFYQEKYYQSIETLKKAKSLYRKKNIENVAMIGLEYYIVRCLIQTNTIDKRLLLNIANSQDTILAEAQYIQAVAKDTLFFSDKDKTTPMSNDSIVIEKYKKVLEIYPEHTGAKRRIEEITQGYR